MMTKQIILVFTLSILLFSCSKETEPRKREYPAIQTLSVDSINPLGATFTGEVLNTGYKHIIEYGFVYYPTGSPLKYMYDTSSVHRAILSKGYFSQQIDQFLSKNITYNVKAYVKTSIYTVYGPSVEFTSEGCRWFPWDLIAQPKIIGYNNVFAVSNSQYAFILMTSKEFYSFDPFSETFTKVRDYPGNTLYKAASFIIDNEIYIINKGSQDFYKYDISKNTWTKLASLPFIPEDNNFVAFVINDAGYYLSNNSFYKYDPYSENWIKKTNVPSTLDIQNSEVMNKNAYIFTNSKSILKYSQEDDNWQVETNYPGDLNQDIVSFATDKSLYYGLSYSDIITEKQASSEFWQYSLESKKWRIVQSLPYIHSKDHVFSFSVRNYGYLGYATSYNYGNREYNIWKFSEDKLLKN
ncbi:hypothetical protein ACE1ET_14305 [Saccharicrinis sp. FJH62]|uniref:hypothetical protein n=1 Tax=Saccharicrinis sp. FJH62 TaxID=3344657 RepID=UPI0035D5024C